MSATKKKLTKAQRDHAYRVAMIALRKLAGPEKPKTPEELAQSERYARLKKLKETAIPPAQCDRAKKYLYEVGIMLSALHTASKEDIKWDDGQEAFLAMVEHFSTKALRLLGAAGAALNDDDLLDWCIQKEDDYAAELKLYEHRLEGKPEVEEEPAEAAQQ